MIKIAFVLLILPWWLLLVAVVSAQMGENFPGGYENAFSFAFIFFMGSFATSFLSIASGIYLFRGRIYSKKKRRFFLIAGIIPVIAIVAVLLIIRVTLN